ncbi:glycosyltransferase family 2 protein [Haloarcula sp. JP-L23]|uniref:glycosyltransferase family 2 protein n=1 Tax=Haloarcula sp. JP-L23 TaxID=2716717 RepID=UPI00140EC9D6|nr:glycosyltransferase family 2 protein [Haloarcula sp. JP-L23]
MPVVSVVIPTYNRSGMVSCAIDSALAQTHEEIEVIVVDDASDDDTAAVVETYDDPRIHLRRHDHNRGGAAARNTGIEAAAGEYIAFLDSDDEWRPEKLTRQLDTLTARPEEFVATYCDIVTNRTGLQKAFYTLATALVPGFEKTSATEGGSELVEEIHTTRFYLGGTSTLLVERPAVERVGGFDERFPRHQDLEFLVRLLGEGKLAYTPEPLVVRHDTGVPDLSVFEAGKRRYFEKFQDGIATLEASGVPIAAYHRFALARLHYYRGDIWRGTKYLRRGKPTQRVEYCRLLWALAVGLRRRLAQVVSSSSRS